MMGAFCPPWLLWRIWLLMLQVLFVAALLINVTLIHHGMHGVDFAYLAVTGVPGLYVLYRWLRRPYRFARRRIQVARGG